MNLKNFCELNKAEFLNRKTTPFVVSFWRSKANKLTSSSLALASHRRMAWQIGNGMMSSCGAAGPVGAWRRIPRRGGRRAVGGSLLSRGEPRPCPCVSSRTGRAPTRPRGPCDVPPGPGRTGCADAGTGQGPRIFSHAYALFGWDFFLDFVNVALLFVYGKYCPIIN